MLEDTTGAVTGTHGNLVISSADVRGEIVFYLRHCANAHRNDAIRSRTIGDKIDSLARAQELELRANQLETAKIV